MKRILLLLAVFMIVGGCSSLEAIYHVVQMPAVERQPVALPARPETLAELKELLQNPGPDCNLPCFWNVRPEYTTEAEILAFLQPVPAGPDAPELIYTFTQPPNNETIFSLSFSSKERIVSTTSIIIGEPSEWLPVETFELSHFLATVPDPEYAYLSINITTGRVFLTLAYEAGIYAQYVLAFQIAGNTISPDSDNPFLLCPALQYTRLIKLELQDGKIDEKLDGYGYPRRLAENKTWTIEHMTGMTTEAFVRQIVEHPADCVELPSYPELQKMGYDF